MHTLRYPRTQTVDHVDDYHGRRVADPYRWLEDADSPETSAWIDAQNAVTESWLSEVPARAELRDRLRELWDHPRVGAPWRRQGRWFQMRNTGLQDQDVLWTMEAADAPGRPLLDPNRLSADGTVALTDLSASHDGRLMAYAISDSGSDWKTWRVRDTDTGEDSADEVRWSKFSGAAWTSDGAGFFYSAYDPPDDDGAYEAVNRGQKVFYHRIGTPQADDRLVYARPDQPEWIFSPEVTEDGRWLVLHAHHGTDPRNRLFIADLAASWDVRPLIEEFDAAYELAGSDGSMLFLLTDNGAPRRRIIAVDIDQPGREHWRELVGEGEATLEGAQVVGERIVALALADASHRIMRYRLDGTPDGHVPLPGIGAVGAITGRRADTSMFFTVTSFTSPARVFRHDFASGDTVPFSAGELAFDPDTLVTEQVFATSADGTRVPMFLVHRRDVAAAPDGPGEHPTLLWGYGGFNIAVTPRFQASWLAWVERGGVLAVANLRGGGEYGQAWHDAGRLANKQNVFDDAAACGQWLIDNGWTRPERLAIKGRSNGGLLAGACLTQRPDLFGAAVVEVGVLDMLRFHTFTIGWAWTSDFGCADDPEQFETLIDYSPLHNIEPGRAYPATLVTTGDHDDRVVPGHSFKFAAALQAAQAGDAPVLLRVDRSAGHGEGKPTSKLIAERADVLAFLLRALGDPKKR